MVEFYELAEKALVMENAGVKLIRMNVGDTNLPTPECAIDAAIATIKETKAGYGSAAGTEEFRNIIAEREDCGMKNVVVGPGSKALLFALISILGKKRIFVPKPCWPAYGIICNHLGKGMVGIDGDFQKNWEFKIPKMERDDLLVICNPLNPASTIYKKQLIEDAIEQAENAGATVIIDEAYKGLAFEKLPRYENAIRLRSFSKEFNMEGWRLGYAIAPDEIVGRIVKFNQITTTCVPIFTQNAGRACLENERKVLGENAKVWQSRSLVMQKILKKLRFEFTEPESGIYIFASHPDINDSNKYAMKALEKGVAIAPGTEFGNDKFIRICVNQPEETLKLAAECLEAALR